MENLILGVKSRILPPKIDVKNLTPITLECDFIWKWNLCKFNQVQMRSLGWAVMQYGLCLYKKGRFGHGHVHMEDAMRRQRIVVMYLIS